VGWISNESRGNRVGADFAHRLRTASGQKEDALGKPLNLVIHAGLTPPEWEISIVDENLDVLDYANFKSPVRAGA